ncbi:MAG: CpsD/CapB family tyrosine-protein kinase [Gammaproteobacteria bacterium]|nr:CpsD/CapB family tyrosine-protein kinase [Gammaproteobacteria bacterium]MBU1654319.1 CpsD/CapB family tyrosine-protein kinase [Gammaproteobacteria bacterium]MBU1961206.1 CpsD/CapB family tyrosine-protein kinase [Gammaproteobacteria bacterium]
MERIKEAIERAKQERLSNPLPLQEEPQADPDSGPREGSLRTVKYQQTKVVELDMEHLASQRIFAHQKSHPMTAFIDLLRTQVLQKMDEHGWRTLGISSPTPRSGKTVMAINLAISIARHTQKTALLVDLDLRRPKVAQYLGLDCRVDSLVAALKGKVDLADAMVNPSIRHLVVLPTSRPVANPAEALASNRVAGLIADLRERYESRIVIFDLAPLVNTDDALSVLPKMDAVLMVVGNGMSTKREIEESLRHLHSTNLLGVVLNKAETDITPAYY